VRSVRPPLFSAVVGGSSGSFGTHSFRGGSVRGQVIALEKGATPYRSAYYVHVVRDLCLDEAENTRVYYVDLLLEVGD